MEKRGYRVTESIMQEIPKAKPIVKEIPKFNINIDDLGPETAVVMPKFGTTHYFLNTGIFTTNAMVAFEEYEAGRTIRWVAHADGVAIVMRGEAEITYSLLATHYTVIKKMTVNVGDVYIIPNAAYLEWKIAPGSRYRHLYIRMPFDPKAP